MAVTAANLDALLKELYAGQSVGEIVFDKKARPLMTMLKKMTNFSGRIMPWPVIYDDMAGRSVSFEHAQANQTHVPNTQFQIDVVPNYCVVDINTETLLRTRADKGAFVEALKLHVDGGIRTLSNDVERCLFRDGSGSIGRISALSGSNCVVTLTDSNDAVNFVEGMSVVASSGTGATALRSITPGVVSAVDYSAGTVTFSATVPSTFDGYANDYMFAEGDKTGSASGAYNLRLKGLDAWLPSTAPSSGDSFFGVDRSSNPTRLAGVRYTGSSGAIQESIIGGASTLCGVVPSAMPDVALMDHNTFRRLVNEMEAQVQRDAGGKAIGGFQSVEVYGPRGPIQCIPCTFCQSTVIWLLDSKTWTLVSMRDPVHIIDQDGLKIRARDAADAFELRLGNWSNLACRAPGCNCRIAL